MVPPPTVSVRPPIIFTDWSQPARREASNTSSPKATAINPAIIVCAILGILVFGVLAYWIPKKFIPWYQVGRAKVVAEKRRISDHEVWLKYVRSSFPPHLESIQSLHSTVDIEMVIDSVGREPDKSDLPFRNLEAQPNHAAVKATDFYISEDHDPEDQLESDQAQAAPTDSILKGPSIRLLRNGVPTLQFKPQTPPHYSPNNHPPVALLAAYQNVGSVLQQSPFSIPGTVHPQFPTVGDYVHGRGEFSKPTKPQQPVQEYSRPNSDVEHSSHEGGPRESFQTSRTGVTDVSTDPSIHDATPMVVISARGQLKEISRVDRVDEAIFVVGDDDEQEED